MKALLAADASIVSITGESTPGLLGGLDPARAALERTSRLPGQRVYLRAIELGRARFCVVAWPVPGWAGPAYPELDPDAATERVAADLLEFCRLAPDDPPDAWARHLERLTARAEALTELALDRIEMRGAGTSLDLGLSPGTRWVAARERDHTERMFCANLPTEEASRARTPGASTAPSPARGRWAWTAVASRASAASSAAAS